MVKRYFNGNNEEIDEDDVKIICQKMYKGKHKNDIKKPLTIIKKLQEELAKEAEN